MMVDDETLPGTPAKINFGYPRSLGNKLFLGFCLVALLATGVAQIEPSRIDGDFSIWNPRSS